MEITQKKLLDIFIKECQFWVEKLGLSDWSLKYTVVDDDTIRAQVVYNSPGHKATISLSSHNLNVETIKESAKHEIVHLMLGDLSDVCRRRWVTETEYKKGIESLVNKLCKIIK